MFLASLQCQIDFIYLYYFVSLYKSSKPKQQIWRANPLANQLSKQYANYLAKWLAKQANQLTILTNMVS